MSEVLHFIRKFHGAEDTFLNGCCYWFAEILERRFHGRKMYHPIENHFACDIRGKLFDVTGEIDRNGFEDWYEFLEKDELLTERIFRDCVDFTEEPA